MKIFIDQQVEKYGLKGDDYLIAPNEPNRNVVKYHLSNAFTHYIKQLDPDSTITRYPLRNTYATLMIGKFEEEFSKMIGLHSNTAITYKNYTNQLEIAEKWRVMTFGRCQNKNSTHGK